MPNITQDQLRVLKEIIDVNDEQRWEQRRVIVEQWFTDHPKPKSGRWRRFKWEVYAHFNYPTFDVFRG